MIVTRPRYLHRLDFRAGRIDMQHGAGGRLSRQLVDELFAPAFASSVKGGDDGAVLPAASGRLVMSTDGHVVSPLFFPGGNIGDLAVNGTVNDVAMMGATPLYLSASFILEEGLPLADLRRIVEAMATAARQAGVQIVCGDTKVVERGRCDGVYISTTGIGILPEDISINGHRAIHGDRILISGPIAAHGMAIMSQREGLSFSAPILSDTAALNGLVTAMLASGCEIHTLRDPTRGGVATTLNEIAAQSQVGMTLIEDAIPVDPLAASACEMLGIDPLYVANEGCLLVICAGNDVEKLLTVMRNHPQGRYSAMIGEVQDDPLQLVQMKTRFGGCRRVDWLAGEPLPRIC
ncbi:hydrogenase expression/formation protein HypE [Chitinibacter sp. S2-10]|uniref:hydrogenase expression/formation protein HypE n=1 Tax=Chitinibacter sp. S2-10 TaxID=3373597 RepID=UPI0039774EDD